MEILIAIVVFIAGIIAVMYLFPLGARDVGRARELTAAAFYGQEKLEEEIMKEIDFTALPDEETGDFGNEEYPELCFKVIKDRYEDSSGNKTFSLVKISVKVYREGFEASPLVYLCTLRNTGGSVEINNN